MNLIERILSIQWSNSLGLAVLTLIVLALDRLGNVRSATLHLLWLSILVGYLAPFLAPGERSVIGSPVTASSPARLAEITIFAVWAVGTLAVGLSILSRERRVRYALRRPPAPPAELVETVSAAARALGMARIPPVVASLKCSIPMVVGTFSPRIVVPLDLWSRLERDGRRTMILHELAHLRRRDPIWTGLAVFISSLFWWNPIVWMAVRHLRSSAELCCDDTVLRACPDARGAYARALLDTAASALRRTHSSLSVTLSPAGRQLAARLDRILISTPPPTTSITSLCGVALFMLCGSLNVPGVKGLRYRFIELDGVPAAGTALEAERE